MGAEVRLHVYGCPKVTAGLCWIAVCAPGRPGVLAEHPGGVLGSVDFDLPVHSKRSVLLNLRSVLPSLVFAAPLLACGVRVFLTLTFVSPVNVAVVCAQV